MGRVKITIIKRTAKTLFGEHKDNFKNDFNFNKKAVDNFIEVKSKKLRNSIAGYVTRLVKMSKQPKKKKQVRLEPKENQFRSRENKPRTGTRMTKKRRN